MKRFVRIGDQINEGEDEFAFFDTVKDMFDFINYEHTFSSISDLNECMEQEGLTELERSRYLFLIPSDVRE